jgi:hypothetical protein
MEPPSAGAGAGGSSASSAAAAPASAPTATVLGTFYASDAARLCALVAAQIDERFVRYDMSKGSRVVWRDVAAAMTAAAAPGRPWSEQQCQRLWRYCAYGEDIGARRELLPDSDGEDDAEPLASLHRAVPKLAPAEVGSLASQMHAIVAQRAAEAAAKAAADGTGAALGASPTTLPPAAHAVVHAYAINTLGSPPVRRSAQELYAGDMRPQAEEMVGQRTRRARARLQTAGAAAAARPDDPAAAAELTAAREDALAESARSWTSVVEQAWAADAGTRERYAAKAADEERAWAGGVKTYTERYRQLYRLVARQPVLAVLATAKPPAPAAATAAAAPAPSPQATAAAAATEVETRHDAADDTEAEAAGGGSDDVAMATAPEPATAEPSSVADAETAAAPSDEAAAVEGDAAPAPEPAAAAAADEGAS